MAAPVRSLFSSLAWLAGSSATAIVVAMVLVLVDFGLFSPDPAPSANGTGIGEGVLPASPGAGPGALSPFGPGAAGAGLGGVGGVGGVGGNQTGGGGTHDWPRMDPGFGGFIALYGSTATFIFSFQGQSIFLEVKRVVLVLPGRTGRRQHSPGGLRVVLT